MINREGPGIQIKFGGNRWFARAVSSIFYVALSAAASGQAVDSLSPAHPSAVIACTVYPAVPDALSGKQHGECTAIRQGNIIIVGNDYLVAEIDAEQGIIRAIENRVTARKTLLKDDKTGVVLRGENGQPLEIMFGQAQAHRLQVRLINEPTQSGAVLTEPFGNTTVNIIYRLKRNHFWLERKLEIDSSQGPVVLDRLVYGKLDIPEAEPHVLKLGLFDAPRLISMDRGGLFAGVGGWFYAVDEPGLYHNTGMNHATHGKFKSEPWYLGVFAGEPGEPFAGWLWYKNFLRIRKMEYDKRGVWSYWNAGWGQWGIEIDDPMALPHIAFARQLGIRSICWGGGSGGRGVPAYLQLARESETARNHLDKMQEAGIYWGCLEAGGPMNIWTKPEVLAKKHQLLNECTRLGLRVFHFDFFKTVDTYTAHQNVADYFRAARTQLEYTECHLGMAKYGPQLQREVILNHPADVRGFDISHFAADWATLLAFRHSRRQWQRRNEYLMPEYGLYYFLTHYANWGHPRRYIDPEPQQFLYKPDAYCGIGYNFHDTIGYRTTLVAAAAFSPFYVFGYLDLKMPEEDVLYTRRCLDWVADNTELLCLDRVCLETDEVCVMSKMRDSKGAVFLINYDQTPRTFELQFARQTAAPLSIRIIYPERQQPTNLQPGQTFTTSVQGENLVILDVNEGFQNLPPENPGMFRMSIAAGQRKEDGWQAEFTLPPIRERIRARTDAHLPKELLSLDQLQTSDPSLTDRLNDDPTQQGTPVIEWLGKGRLPESMLKAYGFRDSRFVDAWKIVPWAFADRLWLVLKPAKPHPLGAGDNLPTLTVNGRPVNLFPRIDYREDELDQWTCPLFHADVTEACRYGENNSITFNRLSEAPAACYLISATGGPDKSQTQTANGNQRK